MVTSKRHLHQPKKDKVQSGMAAGALSCLSWFLFKSLPWTHHETACGPVPPEGAKAASGAISLGEIQAGELVLRGDSDGKCLTTNFSPLLSGWSKTVSEYHCQNKKKNTILGSIMRSPSEEPSKIVQRRVFVSNKSSCGFQKVHIHHFVPGLSPCWRPPHRDQNWRSSATCDDLGLMLSWLRFKMHLKLSPWLRL